MCPPCSETYNVNEVPCRTLGRFDFDQWEYDMPADPQPHFAITLHYLDSNYREIREIKAFNLQTLFGNIGGYVGIFIGYALLSLPDAIVNILKLFRGKNKCNSKETTQEKCANQIKKPLQRQHKSQRRIPSTTHPTTKQPPDTHQTHTKAR